MFTAFFKSIADDYRKAQEYNQWYRENLQSQCQPFFRSQESLQAEDALKMHYQYWDEWTGSRYERVENPYLDKDYFVKHHKMLPTLAKHLHKEFVKTVQMGKVLRSNPVTGFWEPLNVIDGDMV